MFGGNLNILTDIKYGNVCGYTKKELKENFKKYLNENKDIYLVGIKFGKKSICGFNWERM